MKTDADKSTGYDIQHMMFDHRERLVGLFVFSAFILFLFFLVISVKNQHLFEQRVLYYINVDSSEGISQGSVVKTLGAEIGKVSNLSLVQGHKIRVTIEIYKNQHTLVRTGAKVLVNRLTGIGSALIEIKSGSIDAPVLPAGSTLPVEETASLNDLLLSIANLIQSADSKNLLNKFDVILPKLEQTLGNVHEIIAQIATGRGTLGAAVFDQGVEQDLKTVVKSGAQILTEAEGIIRTAKQRLKQIDPVLMDVKHISHDMRGASHGFPQMVRGLNEIIIQAKTALTLINEELQDIPGITLDARRTLSKTDRLLESIQNTWPLSQHNSKPTAMQLIAPHSSHD